MPEENPPPTVVQQAAPRQKQPRTTGAVRSRTSPPPSGSVDTAEARPTKRARKAINCEPCRNSKLKCDRNRPCSSCVLRGTSALCYQDARGHEGPDQSHVRGDDPSRIDPAQEIARLRQSISLLEAHIFPNLGQRGHRRPNESSAQLSPKKEPTESEGLEKSTANPAPGMLGNKDHGGLYTGATSAATHLLLNDSRESEDASDGHEHPSGDEFVTAGHDYDRDIVNLLPPLETIDALVTYYFEYCNWIYRHVNEPSFRQSWNRFKSGRSPDRITLSTVCLIMAIALHYLPSDHNILASFTENREELGDKFYDLMRTALQRHQADSRSYSLDLVELLLIRCHFLTLSKKDSEEIWTVRGELLTIGMAMGLHRDPGKWKMQQDVAERRRWAWWHIILLERWQAFLFGRPIGIASHHFDTELPSYCDPALDKSGRLYLPNLALFRLAYVLGDIMNDAISLRPVPYESVLANDRALLDWMERLPPELDLDEYRIARSLASSVASERRLGVQSVIIRTSYLHIRFTLHRPYASAVARANKGDTTTPKMSQSVDIAVSSAGKLIDLISHSRPDFTSNPARYVPGHMNWGPFHVFSAGMFFSFQLIANPDQPGAGLFRDNIRKVISTLEQSRELPLSDKASNVLNALAPLYSAEFPIQNPREREKLKADVLSMVRNLAFPYHDSPPYPRSSLDSPGVRHALSSPANSNSVSPPGANDLVALPHPVASPLESTVPGHNIPGHSMTSSLAPYTHPPPLPPAHMQQQPSPLSLVSHTPSQHQHQQTVSPTLSGHVQSPVDLQPNHSYQQQPYQMQQQSPQPPIYDPSRYPPYMHPAEEIILGASVPFGQGEWAWFREYTQRPDGSNRHMGS